MLAHTDRDMGGRAAQRELEIEFLVRIALGEVDDHDAIGRQKLRLARQIVRRQNNRDALRLLLTEASAHLGLQFKLLLAGAASGGARRFSA